MLFSFTSDLYQRKNKVFFVFFICNLQQKVLREYQILEIYIQPVNVHAIVAIVRVRKHAVKI